MLVTASNIFLYDEIKLANNGEYLGIVRSSQAGGCVCLVD